MSALLLPHGGTLIWRFLAGDEQNEASQAAAHLRKLYISDWSISDLEMIGTGVFSPLTGFMGKADWTSVVHSMRLSSGAIWPIPITLAVSEDVAATLQIGEKVGLYGRDEVLYGTLDVEEVYAPDLKLEAELVYRTTAAAHPGVKRLYTSGSRYVAGPVVLLNRLKHPDFPHLYLDPHETRAAFADRGWRTVVGFQTRNPIHRAHEYIQKCALETTDGLFVNPLVGATKADDIPAPVRMKSYQVLLKTYYPTDRVMFSVYPASMRYAGPREAVLHAIARKNYGCTHFIVGRDHAGVGNYYGTYDSQHIFSEFPGDELGIRPMFFENSFYCDKCDGMASDKTCPHEQQFRHTLSGTRVRELLSQSLPLPPKVTRPEVAQVLLDN